MQRDTIADDADDHSLDDHRLFGQVDADRLEFVILGQQFHQRALLPVALDRNLVIEAGHDLDTTSYPLWTLDRQSVRELADEGGLVAPVGGAGSVLLFHANLVHASPPNISPWDRVIVYLSLCAVSNHIRRFKRKERIAHRDFTPIEPLRDDCLSTLAEEVA